MKTILEEVNPLVAEAIWSNLYTKLTIILICLNSVAYVAE